MLAKNTLFLAAAEIIKPIVALIFIGYVSRVLGVELLGKLGTILAFLFIFETLAAMGMGGMIVRDIAVDDNKASHYFTASAVIGAGSSFVTILLVHFLLVLFNYADDINTAIMLLAFSLFFYSTTGHLQAILEGRQEMGLKAMLTTTESLMRAGFGIAALELGYGLMGLIWVFLFVRALLFVLTVICVLYIGVRPARKTDWHLYRTLLRHTCTFLAISLVSAIYWRTDVLMLSQLGSMSDVGSYTAAYRFLEILINLSLCYIAALYPLISKQFAESTDQLRSQCLAATRYLFMLAFPVAIGTTILAEKMIHLIYGSAFSSSVLCLQILIWTVCFFPIAIVFAKALASSHNQRKDLMANIAGVFLNLSLNILLIPKFAFYGAAAATVVSIVVFMMIQYYFVTTTLFRGPFFVQLFRPFGAGCLMGICTWLLRDVQLTLLIPVSAFVYLWILYSIKGFTTFEIDCIKKFVRVKGI